MAQIHVEISDYEKQLFEAVAGKGNMSRIIKQYIKSYIGSGETVRKKTVLLKEKDIINREKRKIDARFEKLQSAIEAIEAQENEAELNRLEKLKKEQDKMNKAEYETLKATLASRVRA